MRISDWSSDVCSSDLPVESDRADRNGGPTYDLFCPTCQVQIGPFKFRLPKAALGTVENIHATIRKGSRPFFQIPRIIGQLCIVKACLPLRNAHHDDEVFSDRTAHLPKYFCPKLRAFAQTGSAEAIAAKVSFGPKELVHKISMSGKIGRAHV